jgi:hypothetical protein
VNRLGVGGVHVMRRAVTFDFSVAFGFLCNLFRIGVPLTLCIFFLRHYLAYYTIAGYQWVNLINRGGQECVNINEIVTSSLNTINPNLTPILCIPRLVSIRPLHGDSQALSSGLQHLRRRSLHRETQFPGPLALLVSVW